MTLDHQSYKKDTKMALQENLSLRPNSHMEYAKIIFQKMSAVFISNFPGCYYTFQKEIVENVQKNDTRYFLNFLREGVETRRNLNGVKKRKNEKKIVM